ncbi:MAG TPA: hypothetical protein IAC66_07920 [Candidatus Aphodousia gallistercoris]|nr:hypothetical protein [Candidatus Aphodousia gallistercoris]
MKIIPGLFAAALALTLAGCNNDFDITDSTCSLSHINEVAQKQGLEKAQALTEACVKGGYKDLAEQWKKTQDAAVESYESAKDALGEHLDRAQEAIESKSAEIQEKAENIKKEIQR